MKRIFSILMMLSLMITSASFGQNNGPAVKAEKLHKALAYHEAIEEYQKVLVKEPENATALRGIADCYRMTNNTEKSEFYYAKIAKLPDARPVEKLQYAQALMYNGKYSEAKQYFTEYASGATTDERAQNSLAAIEKMQQFFVDSAKTRIHKMSLNSDKADFSPVFLNDGVVFVSSREAGAKDKTHSWTGNPFLALYYSKGTDANLRSAEVFAREMESKFNDGPVCFNQSGTEMFLTRNNSSVASRNDKVAKLKIVHSKLADGKWSSPKDLPFVNQKYNTAHAYLTVDGKRLYFSSDMPGGFGGMDLYYSEKTKDSWGSPINLGNKINTKGNELFPFVNVDNSLYFASDGLIGLGGLDTYECMFSDGNWSEPRNMGYPLNTNSDDFGLILSKDGSKGYLSSNRSGGKGDDDIYFVELFKKIIVYGTVTEKRTGKIIGGAEVVLKDRDGKQIGVTNANADGYYEFELEFNKDYNLLAQKDGFSKESKTASTVNFTSTRIELNFQLEKTAIGVEGVVSDKETGTPLNGAVVVLMDKDGKEISKVTTGADGYYFFELEGERNYKVKGSMEGYFAKSELVSTKGAKTGVIRKDLPLEKLILNKAIRLDNIYYDLAKWNIRPDAAKELDKLVTILKDNPTIVIELSSHTDCRASDAYNLDLSDKRAKSAAKYIVEKGGVAKERITGKGYGESVLINHCANGVKCSEAEHQENRRTEFKVLKF
jgi:outer membrane protein OmpA-like peptidoglycan-associated protein